MSVYSSTNTLSDKTSYPCAQPTRKRSLIKPNSRKMEALFSPNAIDNRLGKAIMNSPPRKIRGKALLHSNIVRYYITTEEQIIWRYLLRPERFFFMWLFLGLLAIVSTAI